MSISAQLQLVERAASPLINIANAMHSTATQLQNVAGGVSGIFGNSGLLVADELANINQIAASGYAAQIKQPAQLYDSGYAAQVQPTAQLYDSGYAADVKPTAQLYDNVYAAEVKPVALLYDSGYAADVKPTAQLYDSVYAADVQPTAQLYDSGYAAEVKPTALLYDSLNGYEIAKSSEYKNFLTYTTMLAAAQQQINAGADDARNYVQSTQEVVSVVEQSLTASETGGNIIQFAVGAELLTGSLSEVTAAINEAVAAFNWWDIAIFDTADNTSSATGCMLGAVLQMGAGVGNSLVTGANLGISSFVKLHNYIALFANFLGNAFDDPLAAVTHAFSDFGSVLLDGVKLPAVALDTTFGTDLASGVSGWQSAMQAATNDLAGEQNVIMQTQNAQDYLLERFDYSSAFNSGYALGDYIEKLLLARFGSESYGIVESEVQQNLPSIAASTAKTASKLEITTQDLKYLRDLAEVEAVNRFTTAEIKVDMGGITNNVSSNADLDGMVDYLGSQLQLAMASSAEGGV